MLLLSTFWLPFLANMEGLFKGEMELRTLSGPFWFSPQHWFLKFLLFAVCRFLWRDFSNLVHFVFFSFQNLHLGFFVAWNPGNVLSFSVVWMRNSSLPPPTPSPPFSQIWGCYSQYNLISRIRNFTNPPKLHICLSSTKSVINYSSISSFLWVLLWNVSLWIASFVSRSSIFMFVLQILINDFHCLSHRLMYKSSTSVTEVIQRKSACSYLCLPNSCFKCSVSPRVSG